MKKKDIKSHDVIMISCKSPYIKTPFPYADLSLDSGLESMYRKESKGWNRDDGIVKEDSKSMDCVEDDFFFF